MKTMLSATMFGFRGLCCGLVAAVLTLVAVGCDSKVEMRNVSTTGSTTEADREKIRGYLESSGIKGEIYTIVEDGNQWLVDVGTPSTSPPGKRPPPPTVSTYIVEKATGKVSGK